MNSMKAFPFPMGIGTDICGISRIYRILSGASGQSFIRRVLATEEIAQIDNTSPIKTILRNSLDPQKKTPPFIDSSKNQDPEIWRASTFMAGRFVKLQRATESVV
jgi:holo-[acyl-carrier protein] synthase